ncbi:unnamed protein product [Heterobilharzia americana]|nr:unnamed protein product [Heterobilharzia americana]
MVSNVCAHDEECLSSDLENTKICSQASCRRVANHCSNLLDAVLIFKTWFIQRQNDLPPTITEINARSNDDGAVQPYSNLTNGQHSMLRDQINQNTSNIERDWALLRAKRAESQLVRLRSSCMGMRAQLQAGLRHKLEAEQLRRELEMTKDTVSHYQSIINEGNRLRDDLRDELTRVRKEAAIARSRLASVKTQRPSASSPMTSTPHTLIYRDDFDEIDTTATTMIAMVGHSEIGQSCDSPHQDAIIQLRREVERRIRLSESLKAEIKKLRETMRGMLEKEVFHSRLIDSIKTEFQVLCEPVWCLLQKNYDLDQLKSLNSVLNIQCMVRISKLLSIQIPDHVIMELNQFTEYESTLKVCHTLKRKSSKFTTISNNKLSKKNSIETDENSSQIDLKLSNVKSSTKQISNVSNHLHQTVGFGSTSDDHKLKTVSMLKNESFCEEDKVEVMSQSSSSENELGKSCSGSLKFPDLSSDDDEDDGNVAHTDNDNNYNPGDSSHSRTNMSKDHSEIMKSLLDELNPTTCISSASTGLDVEPMNTSSCNFHETFINDSNSCVVADMQLTENTSTNLQSVCLDNNHQSPMRLLDSETSTLNTTEISDIYSEEVVNTPDSQMSKTSKQSHKMITRSRLKNISHVTDSTHTTLSIHLNDTISNNSPEEVNNIRNSMKEKQTSYSENEQIKTNSILNNYSFTDKHTSHLNISINKLNIELFSLLTNKYSSSILQWCNYLSSSSILNEISNLIIKQYNNFNVSLHKTIVLNTPESPIIHREESVHSSDTEKVDILNEGMLMIVSDYCSSIQSVNTLKEDELKEKCIKFLLSHTTTTTTTTTTTNNNNNNNNNSNNNNSNNNDNSNLVVNQLLPPMDLIDELKQTSIGLQIILSGIILKPISENFITLYYAILHNTNQYISHNDNDYYYYYYQCTDWLMNISNKFITISQYFISCGIVFKLLSIDNSIERRNESCSISYPNIWDNNEQLQEDVNHFSLCYITVTLQTLLIWQEIREYRNNQYCIDKEKNDTIDNINFDNKNVYCRLRENGLLPMKISKFSISTEIYNFTLSQHTYDIRCLCLQLVDACLNISRDYTIKDNNNNNNNNNDQVKLSSITINLDVIYSLRLILSAMIFIVEEEEQEAIVNSPNKLIINPSKSKHHQRTRRYRQIERNRQHGLWGWLLQSRLIPWLKKCLKSKIYQQTLKC